MNFLTWKRLISDMSQPTEKLVLFLGAEAHI